MIKKVICKLVGHDWEQRPVIRQFDINEIVGVCERCNAKATRLDAATLQRDPPGWLLDQPPESEIVAMYRDGVIDESELDCLLDKQLEAYSDD